MKGRGVTSPAVPADSEEAPPGVTTSMKAPTSGAASAPTLHLTAAVREASGVVAHARAYLAGAEDARDRAIRDALAGGMTGAAVAAATRGTGAEIREMRVSQIRRGVRA